MSDGGFTRKCLLLPHIIFDLDDPNDTNSENTIFSQASLDTVGLRLQGERSMGVIRD
jgi:hypothetical protein